MMSFIIFFFVNVNTINESSSFVGPHIEKGHLLANIYVLFLFHSCTGNHERKKNQKNE